MSPALRQSVRQRAGDRCEYCRLPEKRRWHRSGNTARFLP